MENKITCFGHKNGPSVRISSDSAPSHLPHFWFGLAAGRGVRRGAGSQGGSGAWCTLRWTPCRSPVLRPHLHLPLGLGGTACSYLSCPPKLWLPSPVAGECAIFVSVLVPVTKASSNAGKVVPREAKRKAGGNTQN